MLNDSRHDFTLNKCVFIATFISLIRYLRVDPPITGQGTFLPYQRTALTTLKSEAEFAIVKHQLAKKKMDTNKISIIVSTDCIFNLQLSFGNEYFDILCH